MNVRAALKADFGIDVRVAGGTGQRADPFVIEACSAFHAVRTQLDLLRGLGKGRRELWRLFDVETSHDEESPRQIIRIDTVLFTDTDITTERRALFFDVGAVDGLPDAEGDISVWRDPRTILELPSQVGWLHFDEAVDNAPGEDVLNASLLYSGAGAKATLYVYGLSDYVRAASSPTEMRARELAAACSQIQQVNPTAEAPWPTLVNGPFVIQYFIIGDDVSVAGIALLGQHVVKLRLTYFDDPKMRELMNATVDEFGAILASHQGVL